MPKKKSHTNNNHIYGINMKKPIQNFVNFHNKTMVHSRLNLWLVTQSLKKNCIRKMDEKYVLNWLSFQIFKHTFKWKI